MISPSSGNHGGMLQAHECHPPKKKVVEVVVFETEVVCISDFPAKNTVCNNNTIF